jgi:hypothetical protein
MNTGTVKTAGAVGIGITVLSLSSPVHAQIIAPREAAQIEFGQLSIYPSLRVVDLGKDENVFNDAIDPKEDYTFTIASRALAVLRLGQNELMFSTGSDYVWFKEHAAERAANASYSLRFNLSASRFKPYVGAERIQTRTRPSVEIDTRAQRLDHTVLAGTSFNLSDRSAITATARYADSRYDDGEQFRGVLLNDALNRTSWMYSGGFRYAVTPLTTIAVTANYTEDVFGNSPLRDSKFYSVTPTVEFSPDAVIRGSFSAGFQLFSPNDPALADGKGLILEGALNWSIMGRTTFDVSAKRNINYSYQDTEPMYLQTGGRLLVTHRLFGPFGLQGSAERQHLSYQWRRGVPPTPGFATREDTSDVFGGGVLVDLGRGFTVLVGAEKGQRRSVKDPRQNFDRTRFISNITVGQ